MTEVTSNVEVANMSGFFEHTLQTLIQAGQAAKAKAIAADNYVSLDAYNMIGLQVPRGLGAQDWLIDRFMKSPNSFLLVQERIARSELIEHHLDQMNSVTAKRIFCANDFQCIMQEGTEGVLNAEGILNILEAMPSSTPVTDELPLLDDVFNEAVCKDLGYVPPEIIYILRPAQFFGWVKYAKFSRWLKAMNVRNQALYGKPYEPLVISLTDG